MAALLPVLPGQETDQASVMAWGFDPEAMAVDPYRGAYNGVVTSLAKLVAAGADYRRAYLTLQESQGFDRHQYAGKTIQRYTYAVKNFPGLQENIWASLLLYQDQVIGGEVYSNQGDGLCRGWPTRRSSKGQGLTSRLRIPFLRVHFPS